MKREDILTAIFENMQTLKRGMYASMQQMFEHLPVSRGQLELLYTIKHLEPVSSKQLAQQLHMTPGAVSQLLEGLGQQGYIDRHTEPSDRRVQRLRLSTGGAKLLKGIEYQRHKLMEKAMRDLSDQELAVWLHVQEKLIREFSAITEQTVKGEKP